MLFLILPGAILLVSDGLVLRWWQPAGSDIPAFDHIVVLFAPCLFYQLFMLRHFVRTRNERAAWSPQAFGLPGQWQRHGRFVFWSAFGLLGFLSAWGLAALVQAYMT